MPEVGQILYDTRDEVSRIADEYMEKLKAPFTYFGGKSAVADIVWSRFGDVANYVEPFCGSLAVLLSRPTEPRTETVNDQDCYLTNFWRSIRFAPDETAYWADYPVSEIDLLSRHDWLIAQSERLRQYMRDDPNYYNPKIAGWWVWGSSQWIGDGWCETAAEQLPHVGNAGRGINRKLPHVGDAGRGDQIRLYFNELSARLRDVRIACGSWERVLGPSVTFRHGTTAVFLDPPYGEGATEYSAGGNKTSVLQDVAEWAIEAASHPDMRIAVCGYEGAVEFPETWEAHRWKNRGGYGSQGDGDGRANAKRETIWFSPNCLRPTPSLFDTTPKEEAA